jgi:lysozyme
MTDPAKPAPKGQKSAIAALVALVGTATAASLIGDIRTDEGRRLHAYKDIAGIVTGCDGDTHDVHMGQVFTDAECDERTARALLAHASVVLRCVPALREVGREQQLRAATRFDYNLGKYCSGSPGILHRAGQWRRGCDAMLLYNKARVGGKLVAVRGLTLRRQRERAVCLKGLPQDYRLGRGRRDGGIS